jgi:SAM-dependent methyltransferase
MNTAEFDKFAEEYRNLHAKNIAISGEDPEYFAEYKVRDIFRLFWSNPGSDTPLILDFGAGVGSSVPFILRYDAAASITCVDVSLKSLELGRFRFGEKARFVLFDGTRLPFNDDSFNIVFAACVFHHIDNEEHVGLLRELRRVLMPGGIILVYEHNPFNPITRHAIGKCEFDECAVLIPAPHMQRRFVSAGFRNAAVHYRVFFPAALRVLRPLEERLRWFPIGAQYYVAAWK